LDFPFHHAVPTATIGFLPIHVVEESTRRGRKVYVIYHDRYQNR